MSARNILFFALWFLFNSSGLNAWELTIYNATNRHLVFTEYFGKRYPAPANSVQTYTVSNPMLVNFGIGYLDPVTGSFLHVNIDNTGSPYTSWVDAAQAETVGRYYCVSPQTYYGDFPYCTLYSQVYTVVPASGFPSSEDSSEVFWLGMSFGASVLLVRFGLRWVRRGGNPGLISSD